jgi:hypothetical protein
LAPGHQFASSLNDLATLIKRPHWICFPSPQIQLKFLFGPRRNSGKFLSNVLTWLTKQKHKLGPPGHSGIGIRGAKEAFFPHTVTVL